jgi:hypothetical protein
MNKKFSSEDVGVIGSYASFYGFLLVATILAYRQIFDYLSGLLKKGLSISVVDSLFLILIIIFGVFFLVLPTIPIVRTISSNFREKNLRLAWTLIFIIVVYDFALAFQLIYAYVDVIK